MDKEQLFQTAITQHQQGNLEVAIQSYYSVIQQDNQHFGALVNLGSLLKQQGNLTDASQCFQKALSVNQQNPELWFNYANLLQLDGKVEQAIQAFQQAIAINSKFYAAHFNLANLLRDEKELEKAETHYQHTIKLKPDFIRAYTNLGNVLRRLNKYDEAVTIHQKAKAMNPKDATIYYNLGRALLAAERHKQALKELQKARKIDSKFVDAQIEIANLYRIDKKISQAEALYDEIILQHPDEAAAHIGKSQLISHKKDQQAAFEYLQKKCKMLDNSVEMAEAATELALYGKEYDLAIVYAKKAITLKPNQPQHYNFLGFALMQKGDNEAAQEMWHKAITCDPKHEVDARVYLGQLAHKLKDHEQALQYLRMAVSLAPDRVSPSINLGFVLLKLGIISEADELADNLIEKFPEQADVYALKGFSCVQKASLDEASKSLKKAIAIHQKNKKDNNKARALMPSVYSDFLFSSLYNDQLDAQQVRTLHEKRCLEMTSHIKANIFLLDDDINQRPINIAYLSPDFKSHPVAFFLEPLLCNHNPEKCKIFCYSLSAQSDETTDRLKKLCNNWRDCTYLSDDEIIAQMRQDNIDIIIDLAGHTAENRMSLLAKRAAPIQAVYLGYPSTTGLQQMDYIIADETLIPANHQQFYTEKPMLLKGTSFLCYQPQSDTPDVQPPPCLKNHYITFGSFNNLPKISPACIALWSKVLNSVPGSRMVLKAMAFNDRVTQELFWQRFADNGIEKNRIDLLLPTSPISAFMNEYRLIDIALDSVPYNGGTTTCDALWMGVPVLTLSGEHFCTRMSHSILIAANMPDWICDSQEQFVKKATAFATNVKQLGDLRNIQRENIAHSALCQSKNLTIQIEKIYQQMINSSKK